MRKDLCYANKNNFPSEIVSCKLHDLCKLTELPSSVNTSSFISCYYLFISSLKTYATKRDASCKHEHCDSICKAHCMCLDQNVPYLLYAYEYYQPSKIKYDNLLVTSVT